MSRDLAPTLSALLSPTSRSVLSRSEQRGHRRDLAVIEHEGDKAEAWQGVIDRVQRRAQLGTIVNAQLRQAGELMAPGCTEELAVIGFAALAARVRVIEDVVR